MTFMQCRFKTRRAIPEAGLSHRTEELLAQIKIFKLNQLKSRGEKRGAKTGCKQVKGHASRIVFMCSPSCPLPSAFCTDGVVRTAWVGVWMKDNRGEVPETKDTLLYWRDTGQVHLVTAVVSKKPAEQLQVVSAILGQSTCGARRESKTCWVSPWRDWWGRHITVSPVRAVLPLYL